MKRLYLFAMLLLVCIFALSGYTFAQPSPKATVSGTVWLDSNGDGIQNDGNSGIKDVQVDLYLGSTSVGNDQTKGNGDYTITIDNPVAGGEYYVKFTLPAGYTFSPAERGSDDTKDSDAIPAQSGNTLTFTLSDGDNIDNDAGLIPASNDEHGNPNGQINGRLWIDEDMNGIQTGLYTDSGLGGWMVILLDSLLNPIDTTYTDNSTAGGQTGRYSFTKLESGTYYVLFVNPGGYTFTLQNQGANDNYDSDVNSTGLSDSVIVSKDARREHVDAGVYGNCSLGDFVWNDTNHNGIQDQGEAGISGVTVELYKCSDNSLVTSTTTNSGGIYTFSNLLPDGYYIKVIVPAGYSISPANQGSDPAMDSNIGSDAKSGCITLSSGNNNTVDAGLYLTPPQKANLGDFVWNDLNHNGIQETGETGISGVTVELHQCDQNSTLVSTTATDGNGNYLFSSLDAGSYFIKVTVPAGYSISPADQGGDDALDSDIGSDGKSGCYTLAAGDNNLTADAGLYSTPPQKASLGDFVWNDTNHNGIQDQGEAGISGVTVELHLCDLNNTLVTTAITDANGNYLFSNLDAGSYFIKIVVPAGYSISPANQGSDPAKDSNIGSDAKSGCITLAAGNNNMTIDAGLYTTPPKAACIGDFVWMDCDCDGIQDKGEPGIPDVTVELYKWGSNYAIKTTTTNSEGKYYFENVAAGSYYVKFILPEGLKFTLRNQGSNDEKDSDADTQTGKTGEIILAGVNNFTIDAGMVTDLSRLANLGDLVWNDCNRNGIQDAGETGIEGVEVKLHVCTSDHTNPNAPCACGDLVATTKTDKTGKYMFTNIKPGYYCVEIVVPCRYSITKPDQTDDWKDSDIIPSMKHTACIKLNPGETNNTVDAGLYPTPPATIGDLVWIDTDKDGIQDKGEKGLCGINVELYMCGVSKPVAAAKTDNDGRYIFKNVISNTSYAVKFYLPKGYTFTALDQGKDDNFDSDVCPRSCSGMTKFYDILPDETNLTIDAGMYLLTTSPCNYVWKDNNNNGIKDEGEQGIQGVTVELYQCSNNTLVQSVKTDAAGLFTFNDIPLESYFLKVIVPEGLKIGKASEQGGNEDVKADFGLNGQTTCFEITEGAASIGKPVALVLSTTGIRRGSEIPAEYCLQQNYPNPFNPSTTIEFAVPSAGQYTLKVFNMLGQEVATLLNRELPVGYHMAVFDASGMPSGMYIYRLSGSNVVMVKKMMLSK